MENSEKVEFLRNELKNLQKSFKQDRNKHKKRSLFLKLSIAFLSAAATVLLGLKTNSDTTVFQNIALIINASISVIATYEAFFKPKKLWVRETIVFSKLKDIERDLEFRLSGSSLTDKQLDEFSHRINTALQESMEEWINDKKQGN